MNTPLPCVYLVRHGQTPWSLSGQHTGRTDVPLTETGREDALRVGRRLAGMHFTQVWTSPSQRARQTCALAGLEGDAIIDPELPEWDYGEYEGLTSTEIHQRNPAWNVFDDGSPHGESVADISARADRVVKRLREAGERPLIFSSGHFLRVLAARWLGLEAAAGRLFVLGTGSISILGYEHSLKSAAIITWNEIPHGT